MFETYESGGARNMKTSLASNVTDRNSTWGIRSFVKNITVPKNIIFRISISFFWNNGKIYNGTSNIDFVSNQRTHHSFYRKIKREKSANEKKAKWSQPCILPELIDQFRDCHNFSLQKLDGGFTSVIALNMELESKTFSPELASKVGNSIFL